MFHDKKNPYVAIYKENEEIIYAVQIAFNTYYCSVEYQGEKGWVSDAYVEVEGRLFLKNKKCWEKNYLTTYLYEIDGTYRKDVFGEKGLLESSHHTKDVSKHFRNMIEFGKYDSILPQDSITV